MARRRSLAPCAFKGCPALTRETYCPKHKPESWAGRRGFDGYKGDWLRIRAQVLQEEPVCRMCGQEPSVTVDHIVPRARGGTDDRSNLQGIGARCKRIKDARDAAEGRRLSRENANRLEG